MPPTFLIHHLTKSRSYRLKKDPIFLSSSAPPNKKKKTQMGQKGTQSEQTKHDPIHQTQRTTTLFQNRLNHQTNEVKTHKK